MADRKTNLTQKLRKYLEPEGITVPKVETGQLSYADDVSDTSKDKPILIRFTDQGHTFLYSVHETKGIILKSKTKST